jgi:hypothetical protein
MFDQHVAARKPFRVGIVGDHWMPHEPLFDRVLERLEILSSHRCLLVALVSRDESN